MNKQEGFCWHVHHNKLLEWCYDYKERVDVIKRDKPTNEIKTRLKLFTPIKDIKAFPKEWAETYKKWDEADKKLNEAYKKWDEAYKKLNEAYKKWDEADKDR